jgi:hypothetical protein
VTGTEHRSFQFSLPHTSTSSSMIIRSSSSSLTMITFLNNFTLITTAPTLASSSSLTSYHSTFVHRLLIVFGSICSLWFILGLIFATIQTFRHYQKKTIRYHLPLTPVLHDDNQSLNGDEADDNDDQTSVFTSVSYLSERVRERPEQISPCECIPEEDLPTPLGMTNMAYSQSTLTSLMDRSFLYYPACRNFAYSQSTLASSIIEVGHRPSPTHSRHPSQSSTTTACSQKTNATYLSGPLGSSIKTRILLPTLMITDCDRLQTDIIELDEYEPEKEWRRARPELRSLLNDRMPQAVR